MGTIYRSFTSFFPILLCFFLSIIKITYASELDIKITDLSKQIEKSMTEQNKTKIAVIEFSNLDGKVTKFGKYLAEELITKLFSVKGVEVIERSLLMKILEEHKLTLFGVVDPASAKELGKVSGSDAIISGTIADLGTFLKVNARLISTETGKIFSVASVEIKKDNTVKQLLGESFPSNKRKELPVLNKGNGLKAEYFNMPQYVSTPGPFGESILTRKDENIDFNWAKRSPAQAITSDYFGIRWTGLLYAPTTGTYFFKLCIAEYDATRLLINNKTIIDHWNFKGKYYKPLKYGETQGCPNGQVFLKGNQWYSIRVDYYEDYGQAGIHLYWIAPGESNYGLIPTNFLKMKE